MRRVRVPHDRDDERLGRGDLVVVAAGAGDEDQRMLVEMQSASGTQGDALCPRTSLLEEVRGREDELVRLVVVQRQEGRRKNVEPAEEVREERLEAGEAAREEEQGEQAVAARVRKEERTHSDMAWNL